MTDREDIKMPDFPKTEKIEFRLRQDLADKLPKEKGERQEFLTSAVELKISFVERARKAGSTKTTKKSMSSAENGKKGGRIKKSLSESFELDVKKDGKLRKLKLVNSGKSHYELVIFYPGGSPVSARFQPPPGEFPDIRYWAEKNGFEVGN
jgi:hypothetical protein